MTKEVEIKQIRSDKNKENCNLIQRSVQVFYSTIGQALVIHVYTSHFFSKYTRSIEFLFIDFDHYNN